MEARTFSSLLPEFEQRGVQIIGVSRDSSASHCSFISKQGLTIGLITDAEVTLHRQFAARGTIRSTFLLDSKGQILKERRNVKATGHAERVLKEIQSIL